MKTCEHFRLRLAKFFSEWEIFRTKSRRKNQNTHFMFSNYFLWKSWLLWDNVGEIWYRQTGHRWQTI